METREDNGVMTIVDCPAETTLLQIGSMDDRDFSRVDLYLLKHFFDKSGINDSLEGTAILVYALSQVVHRDRMVEVIAQSMDEYRQVDRDGKNVLQADPLAILGLHQETMVGSRYVSAILALMRNTGEDGVIPSSDAESMMGLWDEDYAPPEEGKKAINEGKINIFGASGLGAMLTRRVVGAFTKNPTRDFLDKISWLKSFLGFEYIGEEGRSRALAKLERGDVKGVMEISYEG